MSKRSFEKDVRTVMAILMIAGGIALIYIAVITAIHIVK